jgi:hypothetical protein
MLISLKGGDLAGFKCRIAVADAIDQRRAELGLADLEHIARLGTYTIGE